MGIYSSKKKIVKASIKTRNFSTGPGVCFCLFVFFSAQLLYNCPTTAMSIIVSALSDSLSVGEGG